MKQFLIAFLYCLAAAAQAADEFSFSTPPGRHGVGLRIVQQYDHTRQYKPRVDMRTGEPVSGERARPVQALVWYPAARGGTPLNFRNYMETVPTEDDFTTSAAEIKRVTDARIDGFAGKRRAALLRELARPMLAVRDARPASGSFPVVIYAPGFSASAMENSDLCELLASHGYVVLAAASMGAHTRSMTDDLEGLEAQVADIAWLIGHARTLPGADTNQVAVVGFSWGGLANVLAAARDDRIKAIVSLDGSVRGTREWVDGGKDAAKYVTPARVAIPMLFVGRRPPTIEELNRAEVDTRFSFLNEMRWSDVYITTMLPMKHMDFSSYSVRVGREGSFGDYTRAGIALAHSWAARYALRFLDAYIKGDASALAFMNNTPAANGAPPHMILTDVRRNGGKTAPTRENFVARLGSEGFEHAIALHRQFAAQGAGFTLGANEIHGWGSALAARERYAQAREIFRLGTHLYPDEPFLHQGLAEMQAESGQTADALRSYRRVLELAPQHAAAAAFVQAHASIPP
ncbi:dienelactone hydrolase family protein [Massilia sp. MS-15]|uniref:dienelactone hydrolase family protein n=1 Tax=Massilia sp. MS-15 TaxID=2878200 RepID=UPI001CD436B2|nr:dienelactone hydrolase family protein [Massilia sp. MS-15]MCA1246843.1 dienelactone hydrolase family protein [Massilia sp. MS-15]